MLGPTDATKGLVAMILSGPFLRGFTQTINDWYDKGTDAINAPYRSIQSKAISGKDVIAQILILLLGGLGILYGVDVWTGHNFPIVFALNIFGSFIAYIYSTPPLILYKDGWTGNYALGASFISLSCGVVRLYLGN